MLERHSNKMSIIKIKLINNKLYNEKMKILYINAQNYYFYRLLKQ